MKQQNKTVLQNVATWYKTDGFYAELVNMGYAVIKQFIKGSNVLEIGPADGAMTKLLIEGGNTVEVVEPADIYVKLLKKKYKTIHVHHCTIESFSTNKTYDTILLAHVLEHIKDPVQALIKIRSLMNKNSQCIIIVPNAESLHRRIGVAMGMLSHVNELHDYDKKLGHYRVYDFRLLKKDITDAGLKLTKKSGIMIKPLSNDQMLSWDKKTIQALFSVGLDLPSLCAEIVAVCNI